MRALITGVGGFVGRHLRAHLLEEGDNVCGLGRAADLSGIGSIRVFQADLADRSAVERVMRETQPDAVYHLAAQSSPAESLADPWATIGNNLLGQINLFEALLGAGLRPRVLVIGSSDEYGRVGPDEVPTHENVPLRPTTPYAVSKVGQDLMGFQYFAQHQLPVIRVRPFNHTGPGHDARFVIPSFARQLAEIETGGLEPVLRVGNLDVARDFTDARDMVRAYRLALVAGVPGDVYNLGRGRITGITGMAGSFLAEYLADHHPDVEVFGTFRWRSKLDNLQDLRNRDKLNVLDEGQRITDTASLRRFVKPGKVTVIDCELQDGSVVRGVIRAVQPDKIFHLAAQSFVPTSWTAPAATLTNNIVSQVNLFEAVREAHLDPVIHVAGSSEEYGLVYERSEEHTSELQSL